ncbi:MAG: phosphohistidine phosphatase SixA [Candidatus Bathyarchaeota archaeon]|nr:phosphohistidine phosphatase SixA [Candidatus Bathyarchaeota archaeon]
MYLVQHAESKHKDEDSSRPLSEKGWEDIRNVARFAEKTSSIQVAQIVHSGKLRAKQTAEILAEHLYSEKGVIVAEGLEPLADPKIWKRNLDATAEDIMIVGHLPHLSKLAGYLITGDENKEVIAFRMAGIIYLERIEGDRWVVQWVITPEIIP